MACYKWIEWTSVKMAGLEMQCKTRALWIVSGFLRARQEPKSAKSIKAISVYLSLHQCSSQIDQKMILVRTLVTEDILLLIPGCDTV